MRKSFIRYGRTFSLAAGIILSMLFVLGGCAKNGEEGGAPTAEKQGARAQQEREAEGMTEKQAKKLAKRHLALRNRTWGDPTSVVEQEEKFYVYYDTPEREMRLLGARALMVNKETRVVSTQKRR